MPSSIADEKTALRGDMLRRRSALGARTREEAAQAVADLADAVTDLAGSGRISGFWPIGEEIDPLPLMRGLAARGLMFALPVVTPQGLCFRAWRIGGPLEPAAFGLMQPPANAQDVRPDTMLVPLLAFDRAGIRLGYGKGYYDEAIARLRPRRCIGVAFSFQEVPAVPVEPHDRRLDAVVTEAGLIRCGA